MCLFKFIKVQLIFILSLFCVFNTSNARQPGTPDNPRPEPIFCSKGYWGQPNCNNNNFNVCSSNSNT